MNKASSKDLLGVLVLGVHLQISHLGGAHERLHADLAFDVHCLVLCLELAGALALRLGGLLKPAGVSATTSTAWMYSRLLLGLCLLQPTSHC